MAEEKAFENGQISYFEWLVTWILDRVIPFTVVHHSSTSTYVPNKIEELFVDEQTNVRTYVRTYGRTFKTGFIRLTLPSLVASFDFRPGNGTGLFWKK